MSDDPQASSVHEQDATAPASEEPSSAGMPLADRPTVLSGRRPPQGSPTNLFDPGSLVRGERVDHFQLQEYIGVGGMGTVFRAWDTRLQRPVALKVLPREQAADSETTQRFLHEARSAARLNHENIARVYFVGEARGLHYIAFEFVEGTDVRKLIQQFGRLSVNDVVSNAIQIAGALKHAAARDVVHRDIKPSNIVVTPEGLAKLVDMGLARNYDTHGGLTASGVTLGTFDYLSPEQAHDPRTADARSDIYSLGCTLYHMLTGQPPYVDGNALQKMLQHRESPPPDPRQLNPNVPDELANIILRMMRKKPKDRYQSPNELLRDLTALAGNLGLHSTSPEGLIWMAPGSVPVPAWQRHAIWMVPVLGVLLIVVVAGLLAGRGTDLPAYGRVDQPASEASAAPLAPEPQDVGTSEQAVAADDQGREITGGATGPSKVETPAPISETVPKTAVRNQATTEETPSKAGSKGVKESTPNSEGQNTEAGTRPSPSHGTVAPVKGADRGSTKDVSQAAPAEPPSTKEGGSSTGATATPKLAGPSANVPNNIRSPSSSANQGGESTTYEGGNVSRPAAPRALVVDPEGGEGTFGSLKGAVSQAAKEAVSVIELRFNGPLRQGPIPISGLKRLTIRAAEGFHPILELDRRDVDTDEPVHFFSFIDGTLDLIGLQLVLEVPPSGGADDWAMISIKDAQRLHLQDCVLTLVNPAGRNAAFIEARWSWNDQAIAMPPVEPREPTELKVEQCFLRGDGDVVALRQPKDIIRITLGNSNLIATRQHLLAVDAQGMSAPRMEVAITHVTARADEGLLRVNTAGGAKPRVEIRAEDNILIVSNQAAMIAQSGDLPVADFRNSFQWQAHRNFYEGVETFWTIDSTSPPEMGILATAVRFDREYWQDFWGIDQESEPQVNAVRWENRPDPLVSSWLLGRDAFRLADRGDNPARRGAGDRGDAGADYSLVPEPGADSGESPAPNSITPP